VRVGAGDRGRLAQRRGHSRDRGVLAVELRPGRAVASRSCHLVPLTLTVAVPSATTQAVVQTSYVVVAVVFSCLFGGSMVGMAVRRLMPDHHFAKETEDGVKLTMGVTATMAALIIGLLLASAKSTFDIKDGELKQFAANLILLDRQIVHYGPEANHARDLLRRYTVFKIASLWPQEASGPPAESDGWLLLEDVQDDLRSLAPANDAQRWLQTRALQLSAELSSARWLLAEQRSENLYSPLMILLVLWLTLIFTSYGLFAPPNPVMIGALFVCSFSIATATLLILEMDHPFGGLMYVSSGPLRDALAHLAP
jgi:hypothetical protein